MFVGKNVTPWSSLRTAGVAITVDGMLVSNESSESSTATTLKVYKVSLVNGR